MPEGSDNSWDTVLLQCFRDSQMVQALIDTLAPHELLDQSV